MGHTWHDSYMLFDSERLTLLNSMMDKVSPYMAAVETIQAAWPDHQEAPSIRLLHS